jgi:hypothetical protein
MKEYGCQALIAPDAYTPENRQRAEMMITRALLNAGVEESTIRIMVHYDEPATYEEGGYRPPVWKVNGWGEAP